MTSLSLWVSMVAQLVRNQSDSDIFVCQIQHLLALDDVEYM